MTATEEFPLGYDPADKTHAKYDADNDPNFEYHDDWQGLIYPKAFELKMLDAMEDMDPYKKVFAASKNYLYFARYYRIMNEIKERQREVVIRRTIRPQRKEHPLASKRVYNPTHFTNTTPLGAVLGVGAVGSIYYILKFLK